jgi:hypothetical protein
MISSSCCILYEYGIFTIDITAVFKKNRNDIEENERDFDFRITDEAVERASVEKETVNNDSVKENISVEEDTSVRSDAVK